jgi:thioredoxin:protein disulfide reductase
MESLSGFWSLLVSIDPDKMKALATESMGFALVLCFASGILTSFTPCVYPMIPITINIFGRISQRHARSRSFDLHTFGVAAVYVAGMCVTYSVIGLLAGMTGSLFGKLLQSPIMLGFLCLLFLTLALSQMGLFKVALPGVLQTKLASLGNSESLPGIFIMGLISGLIVSPCVGPVIGGILAFVFESSNALKGTLYFFSFSLGLGMLFLLIGGFSGLLNRLPRSGSWMTRVNFLLAGLMLIAASYYGVLLARQMGWVAKPGSSLHGAANAWLTSEEAAFAEAKRRNVPMVVDFTADWCAACHEIDEQVFQTSEVKGAFKGMVLLRLDVTNDTPETEALLKKYGVLSLPTVLFVDRSGNILPQPRVHGLVPAAKFLSVMKTVDSGSVSP